MRPWITSLTFAPLKFPLKFREISDLRNILWLMTRVRHATLVPEVFSLSEAPQTCWRVDSAPVRVCRILIPRLFFPTQGKDPGNEVWRHESAAQTRTKTSLQQASFPIMRRTYEHEAAPKRGLASQAGHSLHMFSICFWSALQQWVGLSVNHVYPVAEYGYMRIELQNQVSFDSIKFSGPQRAGLCVTVMKFPNATHYFTYDVKVEIACYTVTDPMMLTPSGL